jgi:hypothetical protein
MNSVSCCDPGIGLAEDQDEHCSYYRVDSCILHAACGWGQDYRINISLNRQIAKYAKQSGRLHEEI